MNIQDLQQRGTSHRVVQLRADKTLRRISIAIWILAAGCLVVAGIVWMLLLCG